MRLQISLAVAFGLLGTWADAGLQARLDTPGIASAFDARLDGTSAVSGREGPTEAEALEAADSRACESKRAAVLAEPGLLGAPRFEAIRAQMVARAKTDPVVFVRTPEPEQNVNHVARAYRADLTTTDHAWDALARYLPHLQYRPDIGRQTLLREGYLYSESPDLAFAITQQVRVEHLFNAPQVWIQRGELTMHARRNARGRYVFIDGPQAKEDVRLLHLDRIGVGAPSEPLHRDLRSLRYRLHFDRIRVVHITPSHMVVELDYGKIAVPAVLKTEGAHVDLECRILASEASDALQAQNRLNQRRQRVVQALRQAILAEIDDRLPFDEPLHEVGQQDGRLRSSWQSAYLRHRTWFKFNDERYYVYDGNGHPRVPQVCVDFLTDSFERASGTWWRDLGSEPGRNIGLLDFSQEDLKLRRVPDFVQFAVDHPQWFEVYTTAERERIEMGYKPRFFDYLAASAHLYQPGDIVVIRGFTPQDSEEMHYHSFFVYETDPVTSVPIAIAGNAAWPSLRTWEVEARRTPLRTVWHRIRPKLEWLERIIAPSRGLSEAAPPLARDSG